MTSLIKSMLNEFFQGDREQFNQCQTQLETLYDNGCDRTHINEFLVYRLLYSLLLNDYKSKWDG